ncbi:MAG: hypothetical protein J6X12_09960, partial [Paludibacteraceae bacterium]|nr:hypothetical protein [Paludibacteraceae bacterium]
VDSATVIRDAIKNAPFDIDRIFVSEVSSPAAWRNMVAENNEIKAFLLCEKMNFLQTCTNRHHNQTKC